MRRTLSIIALIAALLVPACVTPSIPIPPPDPASIAFELAEPGSARFRYLPDPDYALAVVYVFNRTQGSGVIETARADGGVGPTAAFAAVDEDEIVVTFEADGELASTCVRFAAGASSSGRECGL